MLIPQLLVAVASLTVAVTPDVLAQDQDAAQASQAKRQIVATVQAVNAEAKMIKVAEMETPIVVTDATVFDDEVQLDKLRAGTKVKVIGAPSDDGKFQAAEIRVAKSPR